MSEEVSNLVELKKYLLGLLNEAQKNEIEKHLVSDEKCFQELQIVETEIIQDFVDERLTPQEKKAFDENFIITAERREQINFARALRKLVDEQPKTQPKPSFFDSLKSFFLSPIPAFCSVLVFISISIFVWWNYPRQSEILVALNKSQKNERSTVARISDFDYAPKTEGTRGNDKTENLELALAKARATEAVLKNPTAENYHELGRVYLAEKNFDDSIKQFEKAAKLNAHNAKLNNDLSVALIEKGKQKDEGKLEFFAKANESIEKAIEQDKNLKEAYFNRALVSELLGIPSQAKESWENYLKLDSTSKWADEVRERLKKLEANKPISKTKEQILQDFLEAKNANDTEKAWQTLSRNREMITGKLIPQQLAFLFVDSKSNGDEAKAKESLAAMIYVGTLEKEKSGDPFWADLAKIYQSASSADIEILTKAQESVKKGYALAKDLQYQEAEKDFESAKAGFVKVNNIPEAMFCEYWLGYLTNRLKNVPQSVERLKSIEKTGKEKNYSWLLGHILCWLAINHSEIGETSKALKYYAEALTRTESISDTQNTQKVLSLIATEYKFLKRDDIALQYLQKSLELEMLPEASQRQKWRDYESLTKTFRTFRYYHTALAFGKEMLNLAFINDDISFKCDSYLTLGAIYSSLKKYDQAIESTQKGLEMAKLLKTEEERLLESANATLYLGNLEENAGNYAKALDYYKQAADFFDSSDYQSSNYQAQKGKLFCYLLQKNEEAFQKELPKVLKLFNENRSKILEEQNRNSFFDIEQNVYDIVINYEFNKMNFADAFDYAEESRSRSLLDLQNSVIQVSKDKNQPEIEFSANLTQPLKLKEIQAEMPAETELLVYSVLSDQVLIWAITKDGLDAVKSAISSENLQEKIVNYLELVSKQSTSDEHLKLSAELYQILISPIKDKLDKNKQIFIIPDKSLFRLPFITLYSDKYLVEEYKVSYSPSANVFLNSSRKAKGFGDKKSETILSIGNPTFNQSEYENNLSVLPSAKEEAEEISLKYEKRNVLTETSATKEKVEEGLKTADVVHFAGHYLVDEKIPLRSSLVLAGDKKEESNLANSEIISKKLSNLRLIVLSACDTGIEKYYKGEGLIGASRTFLAANVPLVVASQWAVDSAATKELMIRFHQLRKNENLSTLEALRQTQVELLKSEKFKQPYYWAAFDVFGGYTQF
ncbi:MAG: CHAT domain-containing protein [Acidobacteriota bacterium]